MSDKLVNEFKQEAFTFEALLDGAYGESAPYAAQTGVERSLAENGKAQLESVGLICQVAAQGEAVVPKLPTQPAARKSESQADDASSSLMDSSADGAEQIAEENTLEEAALATFKGGDADADGDESDLSHVSFDTDMAASGEEGGLAGFKKDAKPCSTRKNQRTRLMMSTTRLTRISVNISKR